MASGVTVFRSVDRLMAALFMRQFSPSLPSIDDTACNAESILDGLTTSDTKEIIDSLPFKKELHRKQTEFSFRFSPCLFFYSIGLIYFYIIGLLQFGISSCSVESYKHIIERVIYVLVTPMSLKGENP